MRNQVFKKLFSVLLALIMVAGLLPASVLAEGEGNAETTPAPTEAVQPTESAEPTKPAETETPEVTEVPEPTPENPATTVEPTQGEPTAEPTDEGIMLANVMPVQANVAARDISKDGFIRIFHLDCGREYFTANEIKGIIDLLAENGYTHIELAVGNDGLRFLLKDMSVTIGETTYGSEEVTNAIKAGNNNYRRFDVGELSETEMGDIIAYAQQKNISVIPLLNSPGHMDAILHAANTLTKTSCSYNGSKRTIDITNITAVEFTKALLQKYINYFAGKGSTHFNIGADEYANDVSNSGFGSLIANGNYNLFVNYVNAIAAMIKNAGMTPMAFNDGIYYASNTSGGEFDKDIEICYWTGGWSGYSPAPAQFLIQKDHKIINTNDGWYYVLGRYSGTYPYSKALSNAKNTKCTSIPGYSGNELPVGCMQCLWCDDADKTHSADEIKNLIETLASNNKDYFVKKVTNKKVEGKIDGITVLTVEANELQEVTVSAATVSIPEAAENKVLAYTIALTGENGVDIKSGTVSFPIPAEWDTNKLRGFIGKGGNIESKTGSIVDGKYVFDVTFPVESVGIYQAAVEPVEIELAVGDSRVEKQDGDQTGNQDRTQLDESTATVKVEYKTSESSTIRKLGEKITDFSTSGTTGVITDNAGNFMVVDGNGTISNTTDINNATIFTVTNSSSKYTIKSENDYYLNLTKSDITASKTQSSKFGFNTNNGFWIQTGYYYRINCSNAAWGPKQTDNYNYSEAGHLYGFTTKTTEPVDKTVITFTGVAVGTTSVKVGDVTYNIKVTDKAPEGSLTVDSITLEYWITNFTVHRSDNSTSASSHIIEKTTDGANTEEGIDLTTGENINNPFVPYKAYSFFDGTKEVYYWQIMRLDKDHKQTVEAGVDQTAEGTSLTHIRYRNGAWQYKTLDNTWHYFQSDDQLVAYYLQKTDVTKEIDTYAKDWGYSTGSTTPDTSSNKGQVALTVAVVYPDGTVSPAEGNMYSSSTTIFNYWQNDGINRDIGIVAPVTKGDYTISKITVTNGVRDKNTNANVWYTSDTITWNKKTNAAGELWYDETVVWDKVTNSGTTPMANGAQSNIRWSAKNTAKLVLIYLEPVEKETNLNVHYVDAGNSKVFHQYQVVMKYTEGQALPTFFTELKQGEIVIGENGPWNDSEPTAPNYLPDDAYVVNASNTQQTFKKDITTIPGIHAIYASGLYRYIRANISEDGKTLNLYYDLRETADKTFVVDFGLPVVIPFSDFGINYYSSDLTVSLKEGVEVLEQQGNYGLGKIDKDKQTVTYTLNKMLDKKIPIPVYVWGNRDAGTIVKTVYIIPATNVYYEDSFAKFNDGAGAAENATWTPVYDPGTDANTNANTNQALEALGEKTNHKVYGYDPAYQNSTMFSMGSARKVTVTSDMATNWNNATSAWPTAQFTFKGTGFDIISLTDNTSGAIFVDVYKGKEATGARFKSYMVDNYYGYKYENGAWVVDKNASNALYQIPVMRMRGLGYGEYTAVVTVFYDTAFDHANGSSYNFWLDAVRVYDPMGESVDTGETYKPDGEAYPQYIKLRSELKRLNGTTGALFIDGKEKANISEYSNYGPNNEVYLANGQAITFMLTGNDLSKIATVQIGAKSPNSNGTKNANMVIGNITQNLNTATEMYYDITTAAVKNGNAELVTITNTGEAILSLTNLKITYTDGNQTVSLGEVRAEQQTQAVQVVRALFAPAPVEPEPPEKTFEPERFEASWSRNVMQGRKATLTVKTSEDVEAITVDGQTIRSYRTRTERVGFGRRAKRITYREFTYSMVAQESADFSVTAINAEGTESEVITARITVKTRPNSMRDMWDWFKGWF